jgi:putative transposase
MVAYYHEERPHQALENGLLLRSTPDVHKNREPNTAPPEVACRQRLGGLLKHYYRKAA